jgi:hypothetical protein
MSASPMARQLSGIQSIPVTRRVVINHEHEMPTDFGTTPGGTMFAHTPGGTRIVYERAFLMQMRQSPLARTPPANLPVIPGVTVPASTSPNKNCSGSSPTKSNDNDKNASPRKSSMDCPTKLQTVTESTGEDDELEFNMEV